MQTKPKSNSVITHSIREDGVIVFSVVGIGDLEFNPTAASVECNRHAALHGWIQRISDGAAMERTDKEGNIIPSETLTRMKYHRMNELITYYELGATEWKRTKEGDGSGVRSLTVEAIAAVKSVDYDRALEMVETHAEMHFKGDTKKALAFFRKSPKVQAAMAAIKDSRVKAPSAEEADAALDELKGA